MHHLSLIIISLPDSVFQPKLLNLSDKTSFGQTDTNKGFFYKILSNKKKIHGNQIKILPSKLSSYFMLLKQFHYFEGCKGRI